MSTKQELELKVAEARKALNVAIADLAMFNARPENNVFETLEIAEATIRNNLRMEAEEDCEGSYNFGADQYIQEFIVDGKSYLGILDCEYNRHDKTYYYLEYTSFRVEPK